MIKKIRHLFYSLKRGFENIINWLPVIWKDEDFDDYYFDAIMLHKLKNMEKFFRSDYTWSADAKKEADNIKHAVDLMERMANDIYLEEALEPFYERYSDYKNEFEFEELENGLHRLIDNDTEEQKEFRRECYKNSDELEKRDYDEFYSFLREHIRDWWD